MPKAAVNKSIKTVTIPKVIINRQLIVKTPSQTGTIPTVEDSKKAVNKSFKI